MRRGGSNADFIADDLAARETRRLACMTVREAPIGHLARDQGWLVSLLQFVIDQGRLPARDEVAVLKERAQKAIAKTFDVPDAKLRESLLGLFYSMEQSTEREIFGVVKHG
jgi:hypothetical protein